MDTLTSKTIAPKHGALVPEAVEGEHDLLDMFGALRQLSKEVHDILVTQNRELNQAAMWALGRWWCEDTPKRPCIARAIGVGYRPTVSGVLGRAYRSARH